MNKTWFFLLMLVCTTVGAVDPAPNLQAPLTEEVASQATAGFPSQAERSAERTRLSGERQALENQYKEDMKECYQKFDVTRCRLQARERRIEANVTLRQEELRFKALERKIHALEVRRNLSERNSDAERKKTEADRAAAIAASKERADGNAQKQIDHALQGTKRGEYEQKQRDAAQHRADVEKKLRERSKDAAAPLPVPSK